MSAVSVKKIYIFFFILPLILFSEEGILISGKVTGHGGKTLPLAHVHLTDATGDYQNPLKSVEIDMNGNFKSGIQEPGIYGLFITGVNHERLLIPIIAHKDVKELKLDIRLSPLPYKEKFDTVKIIGDWNNYSYGSANVMKKEEDGTLSYEIDVVSDTVGYQLIGITKDERSVNGTHANYFIYDGGGDYRSFLKIKPGKVKIIFDPRILIKAEIDDSSSVTFMKESYFLNTIYKLHKKVEKAKEIYMEEIYAYVEKHSDAKGFRFDWGELPGTLTTYMIEEKNNNINQFAAVQLSYLISRGVEVDSLTLERILKIIPPDSPVWGIYPNIPGIMLSRFDEERKVKNIIKFAEGNPERLVRAYALVNLIHNYENENKKKFLEYYNKLKDGFSDLRSMRYHLIEYNPDKRIQIGKAVPYFEVKLIDGDEVVSNKSLLGRYYLIDFWASWCNPCVREMPGLHQAYEEYKDENFIILSLSFDGAPGDIGKFREKWQMPWLHSFIDHAFESELAKTFEVAGIPKPILVDPKGKIIATGEILRLENLEKTLKEYIKEI